MAEASDRCWGDAHEEIQGPITRARARRIKEKDDKVAYRFMIAIEETMKEGLKFKNEGMEHDGNPPKLFMVQRLNLEQPMEQTWSNQWNRLEEETKRSDVYRLDMQEHQGVGTRAKAKQIKSDKYEIEQEKFQGLNFDGLLKDGEYSSPIEDKDPWEA
ncbi:hypothetical protein M9H77_30068 [Catharanthus roseus]|uniref:Uncharacterized protein n=1 Tax=Catharanthus roseus TaxID=4058 RepID=A0ACB9ZX35_CATRO|nr:hypothetical protein M9H77_30068 [Catharanthus roseus]